MGVDVPATIRRLGSKVHFAHFRDVIGTAGDFVETWQDEGQTDMHAAMQVSPSHILTVSNYGLMTALTRNPSLILP